MENSLASFDAHEGLSHYFLKERASVEVMSFSNEDSPTAKFFTKHWEEISQPEFIELNNLLLKHTDFSKHELFSSKQMPFCIRSAAVLEKSILETHQRLSISQKNDIDENLSLLEGSMADIVSYLKHSSHFLIDDNRHEEWGPVQFFILEVRHVVRMSFELNNETQYTDNDYKIKGEGNDPGTLCFSSIYLRKDRVVEKVSEEIKSLARNRKIASIYLSEVFPVCWSLYLTQTPLSEKEFIEEVLTIYFLHNESEGVEKTLLKESLLDKLTLNNNEKLSDFNQYIKNKVK